MKQMEQVRNDDAARLEDELEVTRQEMNHTLSELENKVSLDHLMKETGRHLSAGAQALGHMAAEHRMALMAGAATVGIAGALVRHRHNTTRVASVSGPTTAALLQMLVARAAEAPRYATDAARHSAQGVGKQI